jgi:hypothetical protein
MIKILAAAIALAIAAAPGTAMAKQSRKAVKVAAVLGTANLFVFGPLKHGRWHWGRHATAGYVVGSIGCAALTPILVVAIEKRELTTDEVLWSTATCFVPPLALIPLLAH